MSVMRVVLLLGGLLLSWGCRPDVVYRWVDDEGKVHYSDQQRFDTKSAEILDAVEEVELSDPQRQSDAEQNRHQQQINSRWFQQRSRERLAREGARRKLAAKEYRAKQKYRDRCQKARNRLSDTLQALEQRKRTGLGIKVKAEAQFKSRIEQYRREVERRC